MFEKRQLPLRKLETGREHRFAYKPSADEVVALKTELDLRKLQIDRIEGKIEPEPRGWHLRAKLIGHATQICVVSGAPVQNTLEIPIERIYERDPKPLPQDLTLDEDFDDRIEDMPQNLDLFELVHESLALHLPEYPKLKKYISESNNIDPAHDHAVIYQDEPAQSHETGDKQRPFANLAQMLSEKKRNI